MPRPSKKKAEVARRLEALKAKGLVIEQWNLDDIKADLSGRAWPVRPPRCTACVHRCSPRKASRRLRATEEGVRKMIHELIVDPPPLDS
jgi:hypothetical protein